MLVLAAMGLVAGGASLLERRLVNVLLFMLLGLIGVAAEASVHRIRLHESRSLARVRIVTVRAISGCAGMLNLRRRDLLYLVIVAGNAEFLRARLRQNDLAILGGLMAALAHLVFERVVRERLQQLGRLRLVRIVALNAVRACERLVLMSLLQVCVLRVMAIEAERRRRLGQVKIEFRFASLAGLVGQMASLTAHVQRGVAATLFWNIQAGLVAAQAKILFVGAGSCLQHDSCYRKRVDHGTSRSRELPGCGSRP
jgi:hypothetical protein